MTLRENPETRCAAGKLSARELVPIFLRRCAAPDINANPVAVASFWLKPMTRVRPRSLDQKTSEALSRCVEARPFNAVATLRLKPSNAMRPRSLDQPRNEIQMKLVEARHPNAVATAGVKPKPAVRPRSLDQFIGEAQRLIVEARPFNAVMP